MKFGTMTHFDLLKPAAILKIEKSGCLGNGLTDRDEIWHTDPLKPIRH